MERVIDARTPLDFIEFQIFPSQNRYEACVCHGKKTEIVTSGLLENLVMHSAEVQSLRSKGSVASFTLKPPEDILDRKWFTKSTLIRFLHIISSSNILTVINAVKNEMSQLEEARKFHLSLYLKSNENKLKRRESDGDSNDKDSTLKAEDDAVLSDASKNELLRAMDLRLSAIKGDLAAAFDQADGSRYSVKEINDIAKFSHHFGSVDLRDSLQKYVELRQGHADVDSTIGKQYARIEKEQKYQIPKSSHSDMPVKYGASPAKAAQMERQTSSDSEESSFSSEDERPSIERSRAPIRSASPRRSASPMRRIQIGRSGSRRATALTIKSLNYIPAREKSFFPKADNSDEDEVEEAPKKANNAWRMSVQDAISLFESKQRDQTTDIQKGRSLLNASTSEKKAVLRRWSSAVGESSQCTQDRVSEDAVARIHNDSENNEIKDSLVEPPSELDRSSKDCTVEPFGADVKLKLPENGASSPQETFQSEKPEIGGTLTASAEWTRQKEEELNQLFKKMMETKPVKYQNPLPNSSKCQNSIIEKKGGFYDKYKEKRDEKLRGETARKRKEKERPIKSMQKVLDSTKAELTSANGGDVGRKIGLKKVQKSTKTSLSANPKTEIRKAGSAIKAPSKASSLPATRKSWPSAPSPRVSETPPGKTPPGTTSTGNAPTRRRSQPTPPVLRSGPKVETPRTQPKLVKSNESESKGSTRTVTDKKQQLGTKTSKTVKSKVLSAPEVIDAAAKASLPRKVTKKSSVVPAESKPFLHKGSGAVSGANQAVKSKKSSPIKEPLKTSADLLPAGEDKMVDNPDPLIQGKEIAHEELKIKEDMESETPLSSPKKIEDKESVSQHIPTTDDSFDRLVEPELYAETEEESMISPTAWVEIDDDADQPISSGDSISQIESSADTAPNEVSSLRVRHSLSQMLLEESSEPDIVDWGNAENPPVMVYHKDAPKGLKRLLKFARKSKTDTSSTGWSSPSVFSEGEDDTEDSKVVHKRSSENLLKKATLQSTNNGYQKASYEKDSADYDRAAQASISKLNAQILSQKSQEGHVSASLTTTKGTRSFFSLSAFKGSK